MAYYDWLSNPKEYADTVLTTIDSCVLHDKCMELSFKINITQKFLSTIRLITFYDDRTYCHLRHVPQRLHDTWAKRVP